MLPVSVTFTGMAASPHALSLIYLIADLEFSSEDSILIPFEVSLMQPMGILLLIPEICCTFAIITTFVIPPIFHGSSHE